MANATILKLANSLQKQSLARYNEYLEECEADRANGHRPHYCEHGANMWTDYDNICGYCEESISMSDGVTRREFALAEAHKLYQNFSDGLHALETLRKIGAIDQYSEAYEKTCERICSIVTSHFS